MFRGRFQSRAHSGRTLRKCKGKINSEPKVLIDVDSADEVPESSQQGTLGPDQMSKIKTSPIKSFITIHDDDSDDAGGHDVDRCVDSRKKSRPFSSQSCSFKKRDSAANQFIKQGLPFRLSKCKRTYSQKTPPRNYFRSHPLSESSSSESDNSDCELMDDSSGKIREEWEKAASKKKVFVDVTSSGLNNQVSSSGSNGVTEKIIEQDDTTKFQEEASVCSSSFKSNDDFIKSPAFIPPSTEFMEDTFFANNPVPEMDTTFEWGIPPHSETQSKDIHNSCCNAGLQESRNILPGEPSSLHAELDGDLGVAHADGGTREKEEQVCGNPYWRTRKSGEGLSANVNDCADLNKEINQEHFNQNAESPKVREYDSVNFEKSRKSCSGEPCLFSRQPCVETKISEDNNETVFNRVSFQTTQLGEETEVDQSACLHQNQKSHSQELSCNSQLDKSELSRRRACFRDEEDPILNLACQTLSEGEGSGFIPRRDDCAEDMPELQSTIIGEREKLKETDEYKRAAEEEWASRQQQLLVQAEEAQEAKRLRKRKRVETLRIQDMERRQKQRVEEMRETRRKDEETINMKEQLRVDIRKELARLEIKVSDMTSLLRSLGVNVAGGHFPALRQVHTAYKQALLKFHPDRASRSTIREQVEAEEKFKLISRLKEKLLPAL
ncbi:hypothetical protein GIB67_001794 [Kingdonia uniflora]|uniref:J domain-containing protein n=1 Tax=Kingdonia uniflora TaxID=39325 RepID=A0A7J7LBR1_9MAGN|nr:hypothetical protein GIB67_001794 [Kingdonia uniflora]